MVQRLHLPTRTRGTELVDRQEVELILVSDPEYALEDPVDLEAHEQGDLEVLASRRIANQNVQLVQAEEWLRAQPLPSSSQSAIILSKLFNSPI